MAGGGNRDQLVTFQSGVDTPDEYGEVVKTWADYAKEWAQLFYGRGDERRASAVERGAQAVTFRVLTSTLMRAVTLQHRINHGGFTYDIVHIAPIDRHYIEFTGVRAL